MVEEAAPLKVKVAELPDAVTLPEITAVIDSCFEPLIPDRVAEMVVCPTATPVASPVPLTVATAVVDELHVTEFVRFCVLPSLNVPVAVNCSLELIFSEPDVALTAIDCSVAEVTVRRTVFDTTPLCVALTLLVPAANPVANPAAVIVATAVLEELQVTELVRFCVLPSVNVPVAVN